MIARVIAQGKVQGRFAFDDLAMACETWLGLRIGDIQIRRVVGRMPQPSPEALAARADAAQCNFLRLFAGGIPDERPAP